LEQVQNAYQRRADFTPFLVNTISGAAEHQEKGVMKEE